MCRVAFLVLYWCFAYKYPFQDFHFSFNPWHQSLPLQHGIFSIPNQLKIQKFICSKYKPQHTLELQILAKHFAKTSIFPPSFCSTILMIQQSIRFMAAKKIEQMNCTRESYYTPKSVKIGMRKKVVGALTKRLRYFVL
jgi:hypothetical protein